MAKAKLPLKEFAWTPELAYAVGLLVTDGNLSGDGRHINMRSAEPQLLEAFRHCIGTRAEIKEAKGPYISYRVQFGDIQLYNWLLTIGLFPAKTYTIGPIKVPDEFFRDFLRGHLDGDGTVYGYTDKYNFYKGRQYAANRLFVQFISASEIHMRWLHDKVIKLAGVHGAFIKNDRQKPPKVPIWMIKFAKKESIQLLHWLYYKDELPCLLRKKIKAQEIVELVSATKRKSYARIQN